MNATLWKLGYRSRLMDVFYGSNLVNAALNTTNLSPDFVSGASAATERAEGLAEFRDTDPLEFQSRFGRGTPPDWAMCDAHASVEASMAWDELQRILSIVVTDQTLPRAPKTPLPPVTLGMPKTPLPPVSFRSPGNDEDDGA